MEPVATVRPMTRSDVAEVARLHRAAFAGSLGVALGDRYGRRMLRWYLDEPGAIALVATRGPRIVGYVFGADDRRWSALNRALLASAVAGVLRRPWIVLQPAFLRKVPERLGNLFHRVPMDSVPAEERVRKTGGVFDLVGIGVAPDARGQRIGEALIDAFVDRVRETSRFRSVLLGVYATNRSAHRSYERNGFRCLSDDGRVRHYLRDLEECRKPQ